MPARNSAGGTCRFDDAATLTPRLYTFLAETEVTIMGDHGVMIASKAPLTVEFHF